MVSNESEMMSQQFDDAKGPFKGKGAELAQWHREALEKLQRIYAEMDVLRDETKTVADRLFSADIYVMTERGSRHVRWRMRDGDHATWERVLPLLSNLAPSMVWWYHEVQERMVWLNGREKVARYQLKESDRLMHSLKGLRTPRVG